MSDVYCFGHVSTGVILRLKGAFPHADGYGEVIERLDNHSGEATGSALVLTRLGNSVTLEGNWIPNRLVILEFDSLEKARQWLHSPEYEGPRRLRQRTATTNMIMVEGV